VAGLTATVRSIVDQAKVIAGHQRHLSHFGHHPARQVPLENITGGIEQIRTVQSDLPDAAIIVILASGDPLFFGLGRLLLRHFDPADLTFHPHASAIQLAFSRIKQPWQDAQLVSLHGRSADALIDTLQHNAAKIAVLTDTTHTPAAIAQLMQSLNLPSTYVLWVCENLGGEQERVTHFTAEALDQVAHQTFAPLNVVILLRQAATLQPLDLKRLPLFGIPDAEFHSFPDRPGLMTKREVRLLILAELALQPHLVLWDIGAGTGSVSIECARLSPSSTLYAIEKTAMGQSLIQQNCERFHIQSITAIAGTAPDVLPDLPDPDRIFIGGSGGHLLDIVQHCRQRLQPDGRIVIAIATLEHFAQLTTWLNQQPDAAHWTVHHLQANLCRSTAIASLSRWTPLNPVTLVVLQRATAVPPS
jgi:precorrin-6Y C5,15-methyltransferase (decarboxylating)